MIKSRHHAAWYHLDDGTTCEIISRGGEIYVAPTSNAIATDTGDRFGRWECSVDFYNDVAMRNIIFRFGHLIEGGAI